MTENNDATWYKSVTQSSHSSAELNTLSGCTWHIDFDRNTRIWKPDAVIAINGPITPLWFGMYYVKNSLLIRYSIPPLELQRFVCNAAVKNYTLVAWGPLQERGGPGPLDKRALVAMQERFT